MAVIRLILLVAVLGGLTLLLVQNWSPVLSLVFLGVRTQPLPLAIWILFSTTTGAFTSILIATLFNLSNYFVAGQRQTPNRRSTTSPRAKATQREESTSRATPPPPASKKKSRLVMNLMIGRQMAVEMMIGTLMKSPRKRLPLILKLNLLETQKSTNVNQKPKAVLSLVQFTLTATVSLKIRLWEKLNPFMMPITE